MTASEFATVPDEQEEDEDEQGGRDIAADNDVVGVDKGDTGSAATAGALGSRAFLSGSLRAIGGVNGVLCGTNGKYSLDAPDHADDDDASDGNSLSTNTGWCWVATLCATTMGISAKSSLLW